MINTETVIELAARLLNISTSEAKQFSHEIEDIDALYFSIPVKGGDSLIVSYNGEVLYANSSISYDEHLNEFRKGMRTPLEAFQRPTMKSQA